LQLGKFKTIGAAQTSWTAPFLFFPLSGIYFCRVPFIFTYIGLLSFL
jgi:hypothetical protein